MGAIGRSNCADPCLKTTGRPKSPTNGKSTREPNNYSPGNIASKLCPYTNRPCTFSPDIAADTARAPLSVITAFCASMLGAKKKSCFFLLLVLLGQHNSMASISIARTAQEHACLKH